MESGGFSPCQHRAFAGFARNAEAFVEIRISLGRASRPADRQPVAELPLVDRNETAAEPAVRFLYRIGAALVERAGRHHIDLHALRFDPVVNRLQLLPVIDVAAHQQRDTGLERDRIGAVRNILLVGHTLYSAIAADALRLKFFGGNGSVQQPAPHRVAGRDHRLAAHQQRVGDRQPEVVEVSVRVEHAADQFGELLHQPNVVACW